VTNVIDLAARRRVAQAPLNPNYLPGRDAGSVGDYAAHPVLPGSIEDSLIRLHASLAKLRDVLEAKRQELIALAKEGAPPES
jgi:hypothetical protein